MRNRFSELYLRPIYTIYIFTACTLFPSKIEKHFADRVTRTSQNMLWLRLCRIRYYTLQYGPYHLPDQSNISIILKGQCHEIFYPRLGPWFKGWRRFAYGFVFAEKIDSEIDKIVSRGPDPEVSLRPRNPKFANDYLDYVGEYEVICETALAVIRALGGIVWFLKSRGLKISWHCPFNIDRQNNSLTC
jgi:hypothetical protein